MKVAFLSYPMLFQTEGGLQVQIRETLSALCACGVEAHLVDPGRESLSSWDICHVFSAINGNFRIVEYCRAKGVPVVLSPLLRPHWTGWLGFRAAVCDLLTARLTSYNVRTEYREIKFALRNSQLLIALGEHERKCIRAAFGVENDNIRVVPNGIPDRFFSPTPDAFLEKFQIAGGFILNVASIDPHKNQLTLVKAAARVGKRVVLIGPCKEPYKAYLAQVLAVPGTRYIGSLAYEDPLLAAAYAAASVFCLPSQSEVMPLTVLESLAAGTPVVMTRNHGMDVSAIKSSVIEVAPHSIDEIASALSHQFMPTAADNSASVRHMTWNAVAIKLVECYKQTLRGLR